MGMFDRGGFLGNADRAVALAARKRERQGRSAGVSRAREEMGGMSDQGLADWIGSSSGMNEADKEALLARIGSGADAKQGVIDEYASRVKRGGVFMGPAQMRVPLQRGPMEGINHLIASNKVVRRGVLPAAISGGAVAGGAAMTAGAQQLSALMEFMRQGQQQVQRTEESPLA